MLFPRLYFSSQTHIDALVGRLFSSNDQRKALKAAEAVYVKAQWTLGKRMSFSGGEG